MIVLPPQLAKVPYVPRFNVRDQLRFFGEVIPGTLPLHTAGSGKLHDPIHGGVYVSPAGQNWMGTLAGVVTKGGTPYLLSNAHVFYTHAGCCANKNILEPPPVFTQSRKVGVTQSRHKPSNVTFTKGKPFTDAQVAKMGTYYDAGLATVSVRYSYNIDGVGIPTGHTAVKAGMKVMLSGATEGVGGTRVTKGTITKASTDILVDYSDGTLDYAKDVFEHTCHTDHGDSGAMILEQGTRKVVGLTFAGGGTGPSYGVKATTIASALGISFVGKSGTFNPGGNTNPPPCNIKCPSGQHLVTASCTCVKNTCTTTCKTGYHITSACTCVKDDTTTPPPGGYGNGGIGDIIKAHPEYLIGGIGGLLVLVLLTR